MSAINPYDNDDNNPLTDNNSGYGPQTHGFNPTNTQAMFNMASRHSSNALFKYASYTDPRLTTVMNMAAQQVGGGNAGKWLNSEAAGMMRDVTAAGLNSSGGNMANIAFALQQTVGSGARIRNTDTGNVQNTYGAGYVTDRGAQMTFDKVRDTFFDAYGGQNLSKTKGFGRNEIAGVIGTLSRHGAFGQAQLETKEYKDQGQINTDIAEASAKGDTALVDYLKKAKVGDSKTSVTKQWSEKVTKLTADTIAAVQGLVDVYGNVANLTEHAGAITGVNIGHAGGAKLIQSRIDSALLTAQATNTSPAAYLDMLKSQTASGADYLQHTYGMSNMDSGRLGGEWGDKNARIATFGASASKNAAKNAADKGIYLAQHTEGELANKSQEYSRAALREAPEFAYALAEAQTNKNMMGGVQGIMGKYAGATTAKERAAVKHELRDYFQKQTGRSISIDMQSMGLGETLSSLSDDSLGVMAETSKGAAKSVDSGMAYKRMMRTASKGLGEDTVRLAMETNRKEDLPELLQAMEHHKWDKVQGLLEKNADNLNTHFGTKLSPTDVAAKALAMYKGANESVKRATGGNETAGGALLGIVQKTSSRDQDMLFSGAAQTKDNEHRELTAWMSQNMLGGRQAHTDTLEQVSQSMLDKKEITPELRLKLLDSQGKAAFLGMDVDSGTFKETAAGQTDAVVDKLKDVDGGLEKLFGTDKAGIKTALGTTTGALKMKKWMLAHKDDATFGSMTDKEGKVGMGFGGAEDTKKLNKSLDEVSTVKAFAALSGHTLTDAELNGTESIKDKYTNTGAVEALKDTLGGPNSWKAAFSFGMLGGDGKLSKDQLAGAKSMYNDPAHKQAIEEAFNKAEKDATGDVDKKRVRNELHKIKGEAEEGDDDAKKEDTKNVQAMHVTALYIDGKQFNGTS